MLLTRQSGISAARGAAGAFDGPRTHRDYAADPQQHAGRRRKAAPQGKKTAKARGEVGAQGKKGGLMMKDTNMLIRRNHKKIKWSRILLWLLIAVLLVWSLFPIYWIVMTSFKTNSATIQKDPTWIPDPFTLEQYKGIFERPTFRALFNSFSTSLFATLVSLIVTCFYAMRYAGQR